MKTENIIVVLSALLAFPITYFLAKWIMQSEPSIFGILSGAAFFILFSWKWEDEE